MNLLTWNCLGLGQSCDNSSISGPCPLKKKKKTDVIFLMETMVGNNKLQPIKHKLGFTSLFVVNSVGLSGGLALL